MKFPSKVALNIATIRVINGMRTPGNTLESEIKEALKMAMNYDGPKIIESMFKQLTSDCGVGCYSSSLGSTEFLKETWAKINENQS